MNKIFSVLLIVYFLCYCSSNNDIIKYSAPNFKNELEINSEILNEDFIFDIGRISLMDTFLICSGKTNINNNSFHIFSKHSGIYITSFGNIGQGPGEISSAITEFNVDTKNKIVYAYDLRQYKLVSFSINKVLNNNSYSKDLILPHQISDINSSHILYLNNNEFLIGYSRLNRFVKTSTNDTIASINIYPILSEPDGFEKVEKSYFSYLGSMAAKPDGGKFVHATRSGCIMEIFDCSDRKIHILNTKGFFKPIYESKYRNENFPYVAKSSDAVNGIENISCTDKYIYANYNGNIGDNAFNQIAVFDWYGNPIKLLSFKDKVISTVFEENNRVGYALVWDCEDDVNLVRFDIY